jgi:hypothetical protein
MLTLVLLYALLLWHLLVLTQQSSPWAVLGISRDATLSDIRKAYRTLSVSFHPDKNDDPDAAAEFLRVHEAYRQVEAEATGGSQNDVNSLAIGLPQWMAEKANEPAVLLGYTLSFCLIMLAIYKLATSFKTAADAQRGGRGGFGDAHNVQAPVHDEAKEAEWEREDLDVVGRGDDDDDEEEDGCDEELRCVLITSLEHLYNISITSL